MIDPSVSRVLTFLYLTSYLVTSCWLPFGIRHLITFANHASSLVVGASEIQETTASDLPPLTRLRGDLQADDARNSGLPRVLDLAIEAAIWVLRPPTRTSAAPLYRPELCLLTYLAEAGLLKELPADGWTVDYLTDWKSWQWDRGVLNHYLKRFPVNGDVVDVNHVLGALIGGVAGVLKNQQNLPKLTQNEKAVMSLQLEHLKELQGAFTGGPQWAAYQSWWRTAIADYIRYRGRESEVSACGCIRAMSRVLWIVDYGFKDPLWILSVLFRVKEAR